MKIKIIDKKGSVLVFTLFVMILTLIAGISLLAASSSGRRSTISSSKSVNAFQVADSGLEAALVEMKLVPSGTDPDIGSVFSGCSSGEVIDSISGGEYVVTFWDDTSPDPVQLTDCSNDIISDIAKIKSVGTYGNSTRSVETTLETP